MGIRSRLGPLALQADPQPQSQTERDRGGCGVEHVQIAKIKRGNGEIVAADEFDQR